MRRNLFTFATAVSQLLCLIALALWVRSHYAGESLGYESSARGIWVANMQGSVLFGWMRHLDSDGKPVDRAENLGWHYDHKEPWMIERLPGSDCLFWNYSYGFGVAWGERWQDDHWSVMAPHWLLALILLAPTVGLFVRRRRPPRRGFCLRCFYNLTGNTSGICPECGTPIPKEPADESPRPA